MSMRKPLAGITIAIALAFSGGVAAQPKGQLMEAIVTVTKVDAAKRTVYTRGPHGETVINVPENLDISELRMGSRYLVHYEEAVALSIKPGVASGEGPGKLTDADRTMASAHGMRTGNIAGIVESIDAKRITVLATDGTRQTFQLANDGLAKSAKSGDVITVGFQQAVAARVRSTPQPERDPAPAQ